MDTVQEIGIAYDKATDELFIIRPDGREIVCADLKDAAWRAHQINADGRYEMTCYAGVDATAFNEQLAVARYRAQQRRPQSRSPITGRWIGGARGEARL
jgi:hypothetical protein